MGTARRRAQVACALSLIALAAAAPAGGRVLGVNHVPRPVVMANALGVTHCQRDERLPRGARAVRLSLRTNGAAGPVVAVAALIGERSIAGGARAAGWSGGHVVVPLAPALRQPATVTLCMSAGPEAEIALLGWNEIEPPAPGLPGGPRVRAVYLDRVPPDWSAVARDPLALVRALLRRLLG